jgi:hypothetical protein
MIRTKRVPKLASASNPSRQLFNPKDLPKELVEGMDIQSDIANAATIDPKEILLSWVEHRYPTITGQQECEDVITTTNSKHNTHTHEEILFGGKLALLGYALPYFMQRVASQMHLKNHQFSRYLESFVAESTFMAYQNMDSLLDPKTSGEQSILMPAQSQACGFYIRTPIQIWDADRKPVYTLPAWENRTQLLNYFVAGNVNCYVLRQHTETGFECSVLFRGTSNEFNGLHQYGWRMGNTAVYQVPQYDPVENKFYADGSNTTPLFYWYYMEMLENIMPHILKCLEWLKAYDPACERILVTGHSMGGALTLACCYMLRQKQHPLWDKCQFRSYAAPMSCNNAAVLRMEQWIIDSKQPNKFIEVINTDDFVNIQYLLGGKQGLQESVRHGTNRLGMWIVSTYWDKHGQVASNDASQRILRILQLYPEIAASAFLNGAINSQIDLVPTQRSAAFRAGTREEELKMWGSTALKETYNGTLKVFFCKRYIQWQSEYIGKSHSNYVDLNMNILWAPLRMYEDNMYRFYAEHGLKVHNKLRIIPMFTATDMETAEKYIRAYHPKPYRSKLLDIFPEIQLDTRKRRQRHLNIIDYERIRHSEFGSHDARFHRLGKK